MQVVLLQGKIRDTATVVGGRRKPSLGILFEAPRRLEGAKEPKGLQGQGPWGVQPVKGSIFGKSLLTKFAEKGNHIQSERGNGTWDFWEEQTESNLIKPTGWGSWAMRPRRGGQSPGGGPRSPVCGGG